jgi:hypothetical protein
MPREEVGRPVGVVTADRQGQAVDPGPAVVAAVVVDRVDGGKGVSQGAELTRCQVGRIASKANPGGQGLCTWSPLAMPATLRQPARPRQLSRRRKGPLQVLGSDPNVLVGLLASWCDEFDVHKLVAELGEGDAGCDLRPVHGTWTRRIDYPEALWGEYERSGTESRAGYERVEK